MRWCRKRSANSASAACTNAKASIAGTRALVAGADAGQEEALQRPRARRVGEVRAGHEHRVVGGGPGRERARPREGRRRAVLQRGHVPVAVEVDLAPGAELVLHVLDPAPLVDRALPLRLPPDAAAADVGPARLGRSGEVLDRHRGQLRAQRAQAARSRSSVTSGRAKNRSGTNVVPRPGRDVHDRAVAGLERRDRARARMREADAPAGPGQADLAAVQMSREHELRAIPSAAGAACPGSGRAGRAGRRSGRGGSRGRSPARASCARPTHPRARCGDRSTASSIAAAVEQRQRRRGRRRPSPARTGRGPRRDRGFRARRPRRGEPRLTSSAQAAAKPGRGTAARDEVAGHGDDVGLELGRPARRSGAAAAGPGRSPRARPRRAGS